MNLYGGVTKSLKEGTFGEEVGFDEYASIDEMEYQFAHDLCEYLGVGVDYASWINFTTFELHRGMSWVDSNAWMKVDLELPDNIAFKIIQANPDKFPTALELDRDNYLEIYSTGIEIGHSGKGFRSVNTYTTIEPHYSWYYTEDGEPGRWSKEEAKVVEDKLLKEEGVFDDYVNSIVEEHYDNLLQIMLDNEYVEEDYEEELEEAEKPKDYLDEEMLNEFADEYYKWGEDDHKWTKKEMKEWIIGHKEDNPDTTIDLIHLNNLLDFQHELYKQDKEDGMFDESSLKESSKLTACRNAIEKAKQKLKGKKFGENFGQDEVRKIKDKYDDLSYSEENKQIKDLINSFDDWCANYTPYNESQGLKESYCIVSYYKGFNEAGDKVINGKSPKDVENKVRRFAEKDGIEIESISQASADVADSEYLNSLGKGVLRIDTWSSTFEESCKGVKKNMKKLKESSTEEYWDATEIARDGFAALLKFNFGTDAKGNNYIIVVDTMERERFRANSDEEAIEKYEAWKEEENSGLNSYAPGYDKIVEAEDEEEVEDEEVEDEELSEENDDNSSMDVLRERIQKIVANSNDMEKDVIEDQMDEIDNYDTPAEFIKHLANLYITGGGVSSMIYYDDTLNFAESYANTINKRLHEKMNEYGINSLKEFFGDHYDEEDPLNIGQTNRNLLAWWAYEDVCRDLAYELNDTYEYGVEDYI